MSLAADTALEVMGWQKRIAERSHPYDGWDREGRPSISRDNWRPSYDLNQALEVLSRATRGASYRIECQGGSAPLYTLTCGDHTVGPALSLPALMCELALLVVRA